jgi:hypothetical protein
MRRRVSLFVGVSFLQILFTSSTVHAQVEYQLTLIENTADRICGVIKDTGSASSAAAKGAVSVELRGLASQLGTAGVQGSGAIASDEYQGVVREQLPPVIVNSTQCKLQVFQILQGKLLPGYIYQIPPPHSPPPHVARIVGLPCEKSQVVDWLDKHGIYGNRPFDISVYDDEVNWTVNGKLSTKTRSDIAREEDVFRRIYPMQRYTPTSSSATMIGEQCVLTQEVEGYKISRSGTVKFNSFRFAFSIRTDANEPRIIERQTDLLSPRH